MLVAQTSVWVRQLFPVLDFYKSFVVNKEQFNLFNKIKQKVVILKNKEVNPLKFIKILIKVINILFNLNGRY